MLSYSLRRLIRQVSHRALRARPRTRPCGKEQFRPRFDCLEDRSLLSTFTVTNTADDGPGSLRQAITDANADFEQSTIVFNIPGPAPHPILVGQTTQMALPTLTNPAGIVLDATTQAEYQGHPVVVIDGSSGPRTPINGLETAATAGGCTIRGLVISNFTGTGLVLRSNGNIVEGNYIGTNAVGTLANPNLLDGVAIFSSNNLIGGTMIAGTNYLARNVISGNGRNGVGNGIDMMNASNNRIQGNYIGTTAAGSVRLGNSYDDIRFLNGCQNNLIGINGDGIDDVAERNVLSGNDESGTGGSGVDIEGSLTQHNTVAGNYIGTNAAGDGVLGSRGAGVYLSGGTQFNVIGTNGDGRLGNAAEGNVISGNGSGGVWINGNGNNSNVVAGNYIGTNAAGNQVLGNGGNGVAITSGGHGNRIGIDHRDPAYLLERNVISGNNFNGVDIEGGSSGNIVAGNYIGTNAAGSAGLGNHQNGVLLYNGANSNWIGTGGSGTPDVAERNIIAANAGDGVQINNDRNNFVAGNYIGTDVSGTRGLGNGGGGNPGYNGVSVYGGSQGNVIGVEGDGSQRDEARRNVIARNAFCGILIFNSNTVRNVVAGNYIGTNAAGDQGLYNGWYGVRINGAGQNRIGVDVNDFAYDLERNVIGANGGSISGGFGVLVDGGASANTVAGNYIGTDATGSFALRSPFQVYGVGLFSGAVNNLIGGTVAAARNVISGNIFGVALSGSGTTGNQVQGNAIGTQADGVSPLGNLAHGVFIFNDASGNTIGGSVPEAGNVIAYNGGSGVVVASGNASVIRMNSIFANVGLGIDLGADGVTPNQDCNPGGGPNNGQNYPVLAAAQSGDNTTITGTLNSTPNTTFTLDFYANAAADPTGYGQGERYLGSTTVTTGDACDSDTFQIALDAPTQDGEAISATATDPNGNTSEFSAVVYAAGADSASALALRSRRALGSDRAGLPGVIDPATAGTLWAAGDQPFASFPHLPAPAQVRTVPPQEDWAREWDESIASLGALPSEDHAPFDQRPPRLHAAGMDRADRFFQSFGVGRIGPLEDWGTTTFTCPLRD